MITNLSGQMQLKYEAFLHFLKSHLQNSFNFKI